MSVASVPATLPALTAESSWDTFRLLSRTAGLILAGSVLLVLLRFSQRCRRRRYDGIFRFIAIGADVWVIVASWTPATATRHIQCSAASRRFLQKDLWVSLVIQDHARAIRCSFGRLWHADRDVGNCDHKSMATKSKQQQTRREIAQTVVRDRDSGRSRFEAFCEPDVITAACAG